MQFPTIDQKQAIRQLALLGHNISENIYLRFFYPSDDPRKEGDKGRKSDHLNFKEIETYQQQGRGAYFVINGGGHKNDDVSQGRAIFIEHDDLEKEIQRELWKILELPEPTFQVDTGGKSIHSYWVFNEAVDIEKWCQLQKDLLEYGDGDRSIKNPARVMRLAGAWHISHDENGKPVYQPTRMISDSAKTYSFEELRGLIPEKEKERLPLMETAKTVENSFSPITESTLPRHPARIKVPVNVPIPLLQCCRTEVRDWVATGVPQGSGRNDTAINIGLELIAVERHLQNIGQPYNDSARALFTEFCQRSGMTPSEDEIRWKWCHEKNPSPSCGDDGIEACIKGWYWREVVKSQNPTPLTFVKGTKTEQGQTQKQKPSATPQTKIELLPTIKKLLAEFPKESLRHIALMKLAAKTGYPYREIELLARIVEREENVDEETAEAIASLSSHLNLYQQRLDITKYLEAYFAGLMIDAASAMPTAPEYLFNTLLSAVASRGGSSSRIVANGAGGYVQPLIFWTGNVAHSGQAKTPPQQIILKPLIEMEAEAAEAHAREKREYEQDKSGEIGPPTRNRFFMTNVTITTKMRIHGENPRGLLEYMDELSSDFRRLNQYKKGGVGDDREQELNFFNGSSISYDRSDARLFLDRTALSKTGTIQWETLSELMDNSGFIESGYMARFLLCSIGNAPKRYLNLFNENNAVGNLQAKLRWLYEEMGQLPEQDYILDHNAKVLFQAWNHTLIDFNIREPNHALGLVYAKIESYTLRLALWLHLVNSLLRGEKPHLVINGATMKAAIEIASFYLGQHQVIFTHTDSSNQLEGLLLKIHTKASQVYQQNQQGVTASWAKKNFNALKKMDTNKIRLKYFSVLANNGYGQLEGEGTKMRYIPYPQPNHQNDLTLFDAQPSRKIDETEKVAESVMSASIPLSPIERVFYQKVGEIDVSCYSNLIQSQERLNKSSCTNATSVSTHSIEKHQLTNQVTAIIDPHSVSAIGEPPQPLHQPPIMKSFVGSHSSEVVFETEWLLNLLLDLENHPDNHTKDEWRVLFNEASPKINECFEQLNQVCPNYVDKLVAVFSQVVDTEPDPEPSSTPTLNELKALMLACESWVQLKNLHKQHGEQAVKEAYTALNSDEKIKIDGIAATAIPYEVYKYVGPQQQVQGQVLEPGSLVYIDPTQKKTRRLVSVWLLQSIEKGWQQGILVTRDCLQFVEKLVNDGLDIIEGHQGELLDGMS